MDEKVKSKAAKLGFWSIVLLGINSIIGSGIFLLPNKAYAMVGTVSIGVIIFDVILAGSIALCYAEASGLFTRNGGPYLYTKYSLGDFAGYEVGTAKWLVMCIVWGTIAVGFATALGTVIPVLSDPLSISVVATVVIIGMAILNIVGVGETTILDNISTLSKMVPLVLFVVIGIFFIKGANFSPLVPPEGVSGESFANAAVLMFFAFTGFEAISISAEDMENPKRNLPWATIMTMIIVSIFYLLIIGVCIGITGSSLANDVAPLQDAFGNILGPVGMYFIVAGTLVSTFGATLAASFYSPRVCTSIAEDHMLPHVLAKRTKKQGTPWVAICCSALVAIAVTWSGSFTELAAISAISRFTEYLPTCLCIMIFRKKWPNKERSFKIPLGWTIPIVAIIASLWILSQSTLYDLALGFGILLVVFPFYFPYLIHKRHLAKQFDAIKEKENKE